LDKFNFISNSSLDYGCSDDSGPESYDSADHDEYSGLGTACQSMQSVQMQDILVDTIMNNMVTAQDLRRRSMDIRRLSMGVPRNSLNSHWPESLAKNPSEAVEASRRSIINRHSTINRQSTMARRQSNINRQSIINQLNFTPNVPLDDGTIPTRQSTANRQSIVDQLNFTPNVTHIDGTNGRMSVTFGARVSITARRPSGIVNKPSENTDSSTSVQTPASNKAPGSESATTMSSVSNLQKIDLEVYNYERLSRVEHQACGTKNKDTLIHRVASDPELDTKNKNIVLPAIDVELRKSRARSRTGTLTAIDGLGVAMPAFNFNLPEGLSNTPSAHSKVGTRGSNCALRQPRKSSMRDRNISVKSADEREQNTESNAGDRTSKTSRNSRGGDLRFVF